MNPSTCPPPYSLRLLASIATLGTIGLLSGCSMQSDNQETLASEADIHSAYGVHKTDSEFDNAASRNHGAWGGVYMTQAELNDPNRSIVDTSLTPNYNNDPEVAKWEEKFEGTNAFVSTNGAKLYHDSCAGCHMHRGEGAFSAGYYPPLANNTKMSSKYYIIDILLTGFRGMPNFKDLMNDEQIAAVTQYVMTDLNGYTDTVTAADVAQLRPKIASAAEGR